MCQFYDNGILGFFLDNSNTLFALIIAVNIVIID
jgi:hypothetical protein